MLHHSLGIGASHLPPVRCSARACDAPQAHGGAAGAPAAAVGGADGGAPGRALVARCAAALHGAVLRRPAAQLWQLLLQVRKQLRQRSPGCRPMALAWCVHRPPPAAVKSAPPAACWSQDMR